MRRSGVVPLMVLAGILSFGLIAPGATLAAPRSAKSHRNLKLEQAVAERYAKVAPFLTQEAKAKLTDDSHILISALFKKPGPTNPAAMVRANVAKQFIRLSSAQSNLLVFCVLADVARYAGAVIDGTALENDLDSMSEMGETESLRLQMAMDRVSKFMTALSNIMKKSSDTDSAIIQNLK